MLWGTVYTVRSLKRHPQIKTDTPISLLKPMKGLEPGIEENLLSFFLLSYPKFEIIFSVADKKDPVIPLIEDYQSYFPNVDTRLIVGAANVGPNPKVNNLVQPYDRAKYDWCLISDSNTRVEKDYLHQIAPHLQSDVGVVCAVVAGQDASNWSGRLEASYLNTFFARWTYLASFFNRPFVIGKSMCFRRSTADRFGGIRNLSHYIAEDNMFGQAVLRLGMKIRIMNAPVGQHIGDYSFQTFWNRHVRWGRIRKSQAPFAFLIEPFVNCGFAGLLGAIGIQLLREEGFWSLFAAHIVVWGLCDFLLMYRLETTIGVKSVVAWLVREALAIPQWIHMACGSTVVWRGRPLKILPGGLVVDGGNNGQQQGQSQHVVFPLGRRHKQSSDRGWKSDERLVGMGIPGPY